MKIKDYVTIHINKTVLSWIVWIIFISIFAYFVLLMFSLIYDLIYNDCEYCEVPEPINLTTDWCLFSSPQLDSAFNLGITGSKLDLYDAKNDTAKNK